MATIALYSQPGLSQELMERVIQEQTGKRHLAVCLLLLGYPPEPARRVLRDYAELEVFDSDVWQL